MPSFDAIATGFDNTLHSSISVSHTLGAGSDRIVFALIHTEDASSPNQQSALTVTYDGVAMTKRGELPHSAGFNTWEAWYILEADLPATGSYTCAVTFEGNVTNSQLHVISLADDAQEVPVFASSEASDTNTISTNITTTAANAMLVELVGNGHNVQPITHTVDSGQTERSDVAGSSSSSATSTEAVTTVQQYTQTWDLSIVSTGRIGHIVLAVNPPAAGQTIAVGQAAEAEVGQPITPLLDRQVTVGQTAEAETANPIQAVISRDVAIGQAVEAETANPITPLISRQVAVGQASESETANPITPVGAREVAVGQASESETANAITPATARMIDVGQAVERELAQAITPVIGRMVAIGQATEVEIGQPIAPVRGVAVGRAAEVELARLISPVKPIFVPVQTAVERELAQMIIPTKVVPGQLGPAVCVVVSPSVECETFAL